jgi:broad specificity phosphatase PhoE
MPRPILYFARHGQTDWNAERRLQGQHDIPLNALGRVQATQCGAILRGLFARDGVAAAGLDYVSSPLGRARVTMELMRTGLGLQPQDYRIDPRLLEMSFGRWEGYTYAELKDREAEGLAAREKDKWGFVLPDGESYEQLVLRVRDWYESIERDTVVAAHGGVCRALIAHLGIEPKETASLGEIGQGCLYVFSAGGMAQHHE